MPATFDGAVQVLAPVDELVMQVEPVAQLPPAEQSPPRGIGAGFAVQVPAQHACEREQAVSVGVQSVLTHSNEEKQSPPVATDPTRNASQASVGVALAAASALRVHGPPYTRSK